MSQIQEFLFISDKSIFNCYLLKRMMKSVKAASCDPVTNLSFCQFSSEELVTLKNGLSHSIFPPHLRDSDYHINFTPALNSFTSPCSQILTKDSLENSKQTFHILQVFIFPLINLLRMMLKRFAF